MTKLVTFGALALGVLVGLAPAARAQLGETPASYVLKVDAPPAKKGQRAVAKIKITPSAGFHMNKDYPTSLALSPPSGITLEKAKLTGKDASRFEDQGAEFDVAYTAAQPGKKVITGELKFAVCTPTSCDPKKSTVSFEIDVK